MSDLIDKVAKAIYDSFYDGAPWPPEPFDDGLRNIEHYREAARAAIAAMRNLPIEVAKTIANETISGFHGWSSRGEHVDDVSVAGIWQDSIDELLK